MLKKTYIISYDITDDRNRTKASETVKDYGVRVQKSVFECRITRESLKELIEKLNAIIDMKTDSILVYPLCEGCERLKRSYGVPVFQVDDGFRVV